MAKIAVGLEQALRQRELAGEPGRAVGDVVAEGDGWRVADVVCTSGPGDRPFEELHGRVSIAIVMAGTFQYRTAAGGALLAPGSFLLGTPGQTFECAHSHGAGDRSLSFQFTPELFERLVGAAPRFRAARLPPLRDSAALVARACAMLEGHLTMSWEELAIEAAGCALRLANDVDPTLLDAQPGAVARVTRALRAIERAPERDVSLQQLAAEARLSPYHFLRTFARVAGITPHQFALRARLREAALRCTADDAPIIDIALDSGFGDVSNFNRSFRAEFGVSPRAWRRKASPGTATAR